ncbi:cytochrome P450 [Cristinia sonorae]|uniref:Cytochrome P450 n=1 Tax=Cristinia sonorae TaxID=1940300 RepID=A0A8K0ULK5_9AGAR|nr:cytochrome P450 [Cristinia sonorae]
MSILKPGLLALVVACFAIIRWRRSRLPLPPGPERWPIIGNVADMPSVRPWETYREWFTKHNSDVIFLDLPLQPTVILGSVEVAVDLLEKRSHLYSDRKQSVMQYLMGWGFNFAAMPYSQRWRAHRRMFHQHFHQGVVGKYRPVQLQQTRRFLSWILDSPQHTRKHIRHFVTSAIFAVTYGKQISGMDDEYVVIAHTAATGGNMLGVPGAFWIEYVPFLKWMPSWVPGATFKKVAEEYLPWVTQSKERGYNDVKAANLNGTPRPSVANTMLENIRSKYGGTDEEAYYEDIAKGVTGMAYVAGADTTTSAIESFLLAMALFPEVQKQAQAELDRVVGPSRLPEYEDLPNMPYLCAVMMEVMRWMPVLAFGFPHAVTDDDVYQGYRIPKGAMIVPNHWAMLHNPEDYPEPEQFKPERYLNQNGDIDPSVRDPNTIAFGFGRRICPGRHFSNNTLAICIASTLHVFNISAGTDSSGNPVALTTEMTGTLVAVPKDVPCGLTPRSEIAARLVREAVVDLGEVLSQG